MKKNRKFILILLLVSFVFSFLVELIVFNYKTITKNYNYYPKISDKKDVVYDGKWYKTTSKNAYVVFKINKKDNYVNKIKFDYDVHDYYLFDVSYKLDGKTTKDVQKVSSFTHKAIKPSGKYADEIRIDFQNKNFKFKKFEVNNSIYINLSRIIYITMLLFGMGILIKFRNYFIKNIEKAFLFIALIGGFLFILVLPKHIYISWDDQIHLKNAYTLTSNGKSNFSLAFNVVESMGAIDNLTFRTREEKIELYKVLNNLHSKNKDNFIQVNNSLRYNNLIYLPFLVGFKISEFLGLSFITMLTLAKFMNFLVYILLIYAAIKVIPFAKKIVFVIGLLTSNIFLATQFSYDPTIIASIILGIAIFLKMLSIDKVNNRYIMAFVLSIIWASLPKAIYCPLLLLLLFVPNDKFKDKKEAYLVKGIIVLLTLLLLSTFVLPLFSGSVAGDVRGGNTSVSGQLKLILHNPINYAKLLIEFFSVHGVSLGIGKDSIYSMGFINGYISLFQSPAYMILLMLIFYILYTEPIDRKVLNIRIKSVFAIAYIGISILIATALYLSFTEVGSTTIAGVQPRYFNPMLLILLMILSTTSDKVKSKVDNKNVLVLLIPFGLLLLAILPVVIAGRGI